MREARVIFSHIFRHHFKEEGNFEKDQKRWSSSLYRQRGMALLGIAEYCMSITWHHS